MVRKVYHSHNIVCSDTVVIECENVYCERFTVRIGYEKFIDYQIKSEFEKQSNNAIFSANVRTNLMNALLFNYIRSVMKEERIEIADKPGFYLKNESYSFVSHKDGNVDYETDAVRQTKFETAEISEQDIDCQAIRSAVQNNKLFNMLLILDISSFMYTLLRDSGQDFNKIIAVTGCDTKEKKELLRSFFKVYERDYDEEISLDSKLKELQHIVFSRKDEMIIFEDDVLTKNHLMENMKFLYNCFVRRKTKEDENAECNCMILCSQGQTLSVLEEYSDDIIWIDVSDICKLKDCFGNAIKLKYRIRNTIIKIAETKELLPMFFDTSEYTSECRVDSLLSALHMIEKVCDEVLNTGIDIGSQSKKIIADISWYLKNSELFYDGNYITEQFGNVLSQMIVQVKIRFDNTETESDGSFIAASVKDDLLLFTVKDFASIERHLPFGLVDKTPKGNGVRLRSILHEKGYLITNNGDKLLYKASISDVSADRINFVALKNGLLTEEARRLIPAVRKKSVSASGYNPPDNNDGTERILLGTTIDTGQPVYWSIGNNMLMNRHLYVQADSSSGKTTLLFLLAQRLHRLGKKVVILDFAEKTSYSKTDLVTMDKNMIDNKGLSVFENGFSENNIIHYSCDEFYPMQININDCIHIMRSSPMDAIEMLRDLFLYLNENRENDVYIILDEINSLDFNVRFSEDNNQTVADVIFRQGRSVGLNLISATQFLAKKGAMSKAKLFNQSATRLAMHMNSSSSTGVAKSISVSRYEYYKEVLEKMVRGQALMISGVECADGSITNDKPLLIHFSPINI